MDLRGRGFGLLAFVHTSNRTRVVWALILIFVPLVVVRSSIDVFLATIRVFIEPRELDAHTARMAAALHGEGHAGLAWEHLRYALVWCTRIYAWYFFWTLGGFLLGHVAGKLRWFDAVTTAVLVARRLGVLPLPEYGTWGRAVSASRSRSSPCSSRSATSGFAGSGSARSSGCGGRRST